MRALVAGGAGFIGSALVDRLLAEGDEVDVVDDLSSGSLARLAAARASGGRFRFHQLDVAAPELGALVARRRPEVMFHLASSTGLATAAEDPARDAEACLVTSLRVLEACRAAGIGKLVVAQSGAALLAMAPGEAAPLGEREASPARSAGAPARTALLGYLAAFRERHGIEFTALALGTVYGPGQRAAGGGAVAAFARALAVGAPARLEGTASQTRDFVYLDDVVDALARAKARGTGLLVNVGTGVETSVGDLWAAMARLAGRDPGTSAAPARPGDVARVCLDASRAAIHLGWRPWTALEVGAAAVIAAAGASASGEAALAEGAWH